MGELAVLYGRLVGARARGQLEYRASLALQVVATAAITLVDLVAIVVIFQNVPALEGWSLEEVALLYALAYTLELAVSLLSYFTHEARA